MQYWGITLTSFSKRSRLSLRHMLIFLVSIAFVSSQCLTYFFYSWPEKLDYTVSQTEFLTLLPTWYIKTHYTDNLCWWSSGNRRRATSAREVIEVAGSNHAIGVILNLAWGPNNFSPSMIWSWRTRSNSRTGLGAELLLPAKSAFCFYHHFYFGEEKWKLTSSFLIVINFFFFIQ